VIRAGRLRTRIEIQRNEAVDTRLAEKRANWVTFARCWAQIEQLEGREYVAATRQQVSDITTRVKIRWHKAVAGVGAEHRVKVAGGSRILDIDSVINLNERNAELQLMCKEGRP
jgi:SPP1 family predicted phage head-tail adaptor